jgi:hypothetical protein
VPPTAAASEGEAGRPTLLTRAAVAAAAAPLAAAVGAATVATTAAKTMATAAALGARMLGVGPAEAPAPEGEADTQEGASGKD